MDSNDTRPPATPGADANAAGAKPKRARHPLIRHLRGYFLAGVLATAPIAITAYVVWQVVDWVDSQITPFIPEAYNPATYLTFPVPGFGLLIALVALTLIGALTAGLAGRFVVRIGEYFVNRMPVVRGVYSTTKQIFETVLAKQSKAFREVALVEYPRRDAWTIAFITGTPVPQIRDHVGDDLVNVYIPTTPNPTSGFLLFVPRKDIIVLDMTVEEAIKLVVSGGIVTPPDRRPAEVKGIPRVRPAASEPAIEPPKTRAGSA